jgi:hypothetical protein
MAIIKVKNFLIFNGLCVLVLVVSYYSSKIGTC